MRTDLILALALWFLLFFLAKPSSVSKAFVLWSGDSCTSRVKAEILSSRVPDAMMVDKNLCDEEAELLLAA